ncbi:RiPP maturation radical SAM C-methyltransferase [Rhodobacter maris]|uniref:Ribosomal peptide maturation radical SAM protein 1 n=1 Tax=Rhodobacter maris TaxID=446682 RepID=A0A285S7E3_9RHOB|nr:RiPP maturation radical SAM C-methyltransferase [Rhodobacter maris]SOC03432.1 ribosomal peptide maturation radical SAM protein 1 [Rhodobacter maris]
MPRSPLRVALIEAPFGPAAWPSIGTSLLKTRLQQAGHQAEVIYLSLRYLDHLGLDTLERLQRYQDICDSFGVHLGEWVFGPAAFPDAPWQETDPAYLQALERNGEAAAKCADAVAWRRGAANFIDAEIARTDWSRFDIVGFANSYSQLNASVALANRLRATYPALRLIMGGCGCADPMGYGVMRLCPALDAVVMGEGDDVIVPLAEALIAGVPANLPGVLERGPQRTIRSGPPTMRITDANSLPVPDYSDYYRYLPEGLRRALPFYIPVEASRGCWWGAKHHCTFCGLSPTKMPYFRKEPERFLSEIRALAAAHAPPRFMAVDNIMPHDYYTQVCPELGEASGGAEFFFEVKANLDRRVIETFAENAISQIQPGIESLSTPVLKLMKKGTTGIHNVYTLRLAEELGLRVHWSILFGFEGETVAHYRHQAELSRRIRHLRPPLGLVRCEVERFAPMYRFPEEHGLENLRPSRWYRYCHPAEAETLALLAYRFDADRSPERLAILDQIATETAGPVQDWRNAYAERSHRLVIADAHLVIRRVGDFQIDYVLGPVAARLMGDLAAPTGLAKIGVTRWWSHPSPYLDPLVSAQIAAENSRMRRAHEIDGTDPTEVFIQLLAHGLVAEEDGLAVALPLFSAPVVPRTEIPRALARQLSGITEGARP